MAPYSTSVILPTTLEPTVGAFFLGAVASVGLTGITTLQSWLYFQKYPHDRAIYKALVAFTWALEFLRACVTIHGGYYYSVKKWGNVPALLQPVWSMRLMVLLTGLVELAVHYFFVHKVWKATHGRAKLLSSIIALFVLADFVLGLISYITSTMEIDFISIFRGTPQHAAIGGLSCAIGADWLITFALVKFFRESKSQFHKTNRILDKLIFYAINMGLLISITDAIVLVLAIVPWSTLNFYQLTVYELVGSLYANSLLACLNARDIASEEFRGSQPPSHILAGSVGTVTDTTNQIIQIPRQAWTSSESGRTYQQPPMELKTTKFAYAV